MPLYESTEFYPTDVDDLKRRIKYVEAKVQPTSLVVGEVEVVNIVRIELGPSGNKIVNPDFSVDSVFALNNNTDADPNYYSNGAGGYWGGTPLSREGVRAARFNVDAQTATALLGLNGYWESSSGQVAAVEGDIFFVSGFARYLVEAPTIQPRIVVSFRDSGGVAVQTRANDWPQLTTGYTKATVTTTAPANTSYVAFYVSIPSGNTAETAMLFDSFYARQMVSTEIVL